MSLTRIKKRPALHSYHSPACLPALASTCLRVRQADARSQVHVCPVRTLAFPILLFVVRNIQIMYTYLHWGFAC